MPVPALVMLPSPAVASLMTPENVELRLLVKPIVRLVPVAFCRTTLPLPLNEPMAGAALVKLIVPTAVAELVFTVKRRHGSRWQR